MQTPSIPILFYDKDCPLCAGFARLLSKNIPSHHLQLSPLTDAQKDIEILTPQQTKLKGRQAVQWLAAHLPESKKYFWMLPDSLRVKAAIQGYGFLKILRKLLGRRGCNCSKGSR